MSIPQVQRDDSSAPFFDAAARGELLIKRCSDCGVYGPPRQRSCRRCGSEMGWQPASGEATLITWTTKPSADPDTAPTPFGYVELAEGAWLETLLVDLSPGDRIEGAPLQVQFLREGTGEPIPVFGPANSPRK
jgi:uncharacterized protein